MQTSIITFIAGLILGIVGCYQLFGGSSTGPVKRTEQMKTVSTITEIIPPPPNSPEGTKPVIRKTRITESTPVTVQAKSKYSLGLGADLINSGIYAYRADASIRLADTPLHLVVGATTTPMLTLGIRYEFGADR